MPGIIEIHNKKYFKVDKEKLIKLLEHEKLSNHFRKNFEPYLFKRLYLSGDAIVKQERRPAILLKNVIISDNLNSFVSLGEADHIWIKCDNDMFSTMMIGERYTFGGILYPYINSKNELNIGFNASGKVLKCKEPLNDKRKELLDAYTVSTMSKFE